MKKIAWTLAALVGCSSGPVSEVRSTDVSLPPMPSSSGEAAPSSAPLATASASDPAEPALGPLGRARVESARAQAQGFAAAVELWQTTQADRCPRFQELLQAGVLDPKSSELDPWGTPYRIECTDIGAHVISSGPDRQPATRDDVVGSSH